MRKISKAATVLISFQLWIRIYLFAEALQRTKLDGNATAADEPCVMARLQERAKIELGNVMIHMPLLCSGRGIFEHRITTSLGL